MPALRSLLWLALFASPIFGGKAFHNRKAFDNRPVLLEVKEEESIEGIPECTRGGIDSCKRVEVDFTAFEADSITFVTESVLTKRHTRFSGNSVAYDYRGMGGSGGIFSVIDGNRLHARVFIRRGRRSFSIENCGSPACHVLIEESNNNNEGQRAFPTGPTRDMVREAMMTALDRQTVDTTTHTTISIQFHVTADFVDATSDVPGYVSLLIAETNTGFSNSDIPITLTSQCIQNTTFVEPGGLAISTAFNWWATINNLDSTTLRNTADMAILLAMNISDCSAAVGVGYTDKNTVGVVRKGCPVMALGSVIGTMFGAVEQIEASPLTPIGGYAYGRLMRTVCGEDSGFRTIMTTTNQSFPVQINYYSSPEVFYEGVPTGVSGSADVRRAILLRRMTFAAIGDESGSCTGGFTTTTEATTMPTPPTTTSTTSTSTTTTTTTATTTTSVTTTTTATTSTAITTTTITATTTTTTTTSSCFDKDPTCPTSLASFCSISSQVVTHCRLTCGACTP